MRATLIALRTARRTALLLLALGLAACATPTDFPVDKQFGARAPYGDGAHPGIDYAIPTGTPVIAVSGGKVVNVRPAPDGIENGLEVMVLHGKHFISLYAHLSSVVVEKDQPVERGQLLGFSGASNNYGKRDNQHLHFGICQIGVSCRNHSDALDPGLFWIGGKPQCFDPKASYSEYTNRDLTGPLACEGKARAGGAARVRLDSGLVSGVDEAGVTAYLGIPYAAPPVGGLRWKPPQPVAAWKGVRRCAAFGPACPQPKQDPKGIYSEDCLSLNVWTPARKAGDRLPVMVWIHGGGFNFGASSMPEYHGANLARQGVVLVTLNYRLGPLGYLVHPGLDAESAQGTSGNYGLLDQIAALKWVRRNIAAFGGDPGNVTLFGQSAGSRSVSLQLLSPLSQGLFHRAIAQSGGPIIGSEYLSPAFNGDKAAVSKMGEELAHRLGCEGPDVLARMRAKTAQEVVAAAACDTGLFADEIFFAPVFDGRVLPPAPLAAFQAGEQHRVPVIVGSTANEGAMYLRGEKDLTQARYDAFLQTRFGAAAAQARAMFPAATAADVPGAIDRLITVAANAQPARYVARKMVEQGNKAFVYRFSRVPATELARQAGAFHGVDLAYVFGNMGETEGYAAYDRELSRLMMGYWVNFAKTGDPNGRGLPQWSVYTASGDGHMDFGDAVQPGTGLYRDECDFIEAQWSRRKKQ